MNNEKHPKHPHPVFPETPEKGADKEEKEKRERSEKKKEQLKKLLVFAGLGILFLISLWLIFSPSAQERQKEERTAGLNETVPQATDGELPDNKLKGYELGRDEEKESHRQETLGNLYDYFEKKDETREQELSEEAASDGLHPIERSVSRYEETSQMVHSFYEPPAYDYEKEALREELDMIRSELATLKEEKEEEIDHLELLEKSYRMAAKYFPASGDANSRDAYTRSQERPADAPAPKTAVTAERAALPAVELLPEKKAIVSSLDQPMSDSAFIAEYGHKERNFGFRSADVPASSVTRNTLRVVVDRTTTLQHGDFVQLRLLESARLHDLSIPRHTRLMAQARIDVNRMKLHITSIEYGGRIVSVQLSAFDTDGQEGVFIPGSEEVSALKEVGANMGGTVGNSFTFASSAKDQILSEAARGVMQGASQLLQKKLRTVKVTLKGGYRLFLVQTK